MIRLIDALAWLIALPLAVLVKLVAFGYWIAHGCERGERK